jgi:hypothetical protein
MTEDGTSRQWPADMPGVTTAWLALANGVSERTIRWRRAKYKTPPEGLPVIDADIALDMVRGRPKGAHIGLWTRLAMKERVAAGSTYRAVAAEFSVSVASVQRAVHRGGRGFQPLSFGRVRSASQSQNLKNFQE